MEQSLNSDIRSPYPSILIALPADHIFEWVCKFLSEKGVMLQEATSYEDALIHIRADRVQGMITKAEWAVPNADGTRQGLLVESQKRTPALILVDSRDFHHYFTQYYAIFLPYNPSLAFDDYIHVPFTAEEFWSRTTLLISAIRSQVDEPPKE